MDRAHRFNSSWKMAGFVASVLGLVALLLALYRGYAFVVQVTGSPAEALISLAILVSFLCGLGSVAGCVAINLVRADRRPAHARLIPWQALILAGSLIACSMLGFLGYVIWRDLPILAAAAKGVSVLVGLGLALILSGRYQRRLHLAEQEWL